MNRRGKAQSGKRQAACRAGALRAKAGKRKHGTERWGQKNIWQKDGRCLLPMNGPSPGLAATLSHPMGEGLGVRALLRAGSRPRPQNSRWSLPGYSALVVVLAALWVVTCGSAASRENARTSAGASSGERISPAAGPLDGDRFSLAPISLWQGPKGATSWWWQVEFPQAERIGAILQ